ncbi:MAG: Gfo/Idh/MocA family oxidoreductase [Paracoccaceae bacterium]|nr:MAG: Gfo/Idh/MocA family oxidoreductase [Paracoccaceae bacterium]
MRVLVIGTGSIGRRHAANLTDLGATVAALSWRETTLAEIEGRLASSDAAVIATATDIRLPLVVACAAAGVPFYCEKPLAFRQADLDALMAAAAPVAARSMAGYMMRWHPAFRALAQADLGDVYRFSFEIGHDVNAWRADWRFTDSYAARAEGGGVLLDLCHEIDMAACLFPGLRLAGVESLGHRRFPGVDMASRLALATPGGIQGSIAMDYLAPALIRRAHLAGQRMLHDWDFAAQCYAVTGAGGRQTVDLPHARNAMFLDAMRDFMALVTGAPVSDVEHLPRLDRLGDGPALTCAAWAQRRFAGTIEKDLS